MRRIPLGTDRQEGPTTISPGTRKYATEFTLCLTVHVDYIGRPQSLPELSTLDFERPPHLYILTSLPLITADPETVQIDDKFISGSMRIHHADEFTTYGFRSRHPFGSGCTILSPWPHDEFEVFSGDGQLRGGGVFANLGLLSELDSPLQASDFHVLYVGQAYGAEGERTAPERLSSHSTFQRILADCPRDKQIWWMVASISDEQYFIEMPPPGHPSSTTEEEDRAHVKLVTETIDNPSFRESEAVSLAEAGLIRYFQPQYNEIFKNEFPGRRHKVLNSLRHLDLIALIVELQAQDIPVRLRSERVDSNVYHLATFYIHLDGPDRISDWAMRGLFEPAPD